MQPLKCRRHARGVNLLCARQSAFAIRFQNRRGKFRERLKQRAGHRIGGNQIRNLLRHVAQRDFRWRIALAPAPISAIRPVDPPLQAAPSIAAAQSHIPRRSDAACSPTWNAGLLLQAFHLINGHPQVVRHHEPKRKRVVAILQSLLRGFEQLLVQIVVQLLARRQRIARNALNVATLSARCFFLRSMPAGESSIHRPFCPGYPTSVAISGYSPSSLSSRLPGTLGI